MSWQSTLFLKIDHIFWEGFKSLSVNSSKILSSLVEYSWLIYMFLFFNFSKIGFTTESSTDLLCVIMISLFSKLVSQILKYLAI